MRTQSWSDATTKHRRGQTPEAQPARSALPASGPLVSPTAWACHPSPLCQEPC